MTLCDQCWRSFVSLPTNTATGLAALSLRSSLLALVRRAIVVCGFALCPGPLEAQAPNVARSVAELKKLTVEELMAVQVSSVSRTEERLGNAPAAVAVVTSEDIRRSGATSVPEALRLVPGIHVARESSSEWAISSRGFSSVNSEKLLVLSDTRSVYTPLFSGVFWDVQDYLLQDIDRIEVIRGPGATLWGSNAVNGVINVTTKSARDTQGLYFETSAGTEERAAVAARYGGEVANGAYYRIFAKYFDRDGTFSANQASPDDWQAGHFGFRSDWDATARDTLTIQGDVYRGDVGQMAPSVTVIGRPGPTGRLRVGVSGGNVLTRWKRALSPGSDLQLRFYYDRTHRDDPSFTDTLDTVDFDLQHRFAQGSRHDITWSANYRATANDNQSGGIFAVDPSFSRDQVVSGFVQDQIRLLDPLHVTVGAKVEHNDFSGTEVQPSGRVAWRPQRHTLWGAVSRAARVPTRFERDIAIDVTNPAGNPIVRLQGNRGFDSERLLAYEAGYRWQTMRTLSVDTAVFHNRYQGLASLERGEPFLDPRVGRTIIPLQSHNLTDGRARGVEVLATYAPFLPLRVTASYSHVDLRLDPQGDDINRGRFLAGSTPRHQFGLRSYLDLPARFQFDVMWRRLSAIRQIPRIVSGEGLAGYAELDVRLAWDGWRRLELSLVGQNLLHDHHAEFGEPAARGEIQRGVYGKLAWGF